MATDYSFTGLANDKTNYKLFLSWSPLPTVQQASAWTLHIGSQSMAFSNLSREGGSWTWTNSSLWSGPNTPFRDGATVEVKISTNTAPTASAGTVMATEDTAYAFAAANFNFSDADTSDTLSAVSIETLPALGTLALSGTAVSAGDSINSTDLGAGNLTYTPPADGYGDGLASFTFKVSDGVAESAISYTMTINVMNVNDDPTGAPAIMGEPVAGTTLTLDLSGIMDADGLPDNAADFEITWYHTDNLNDDIGFGPTLQLITSRDIGKNLQVVVGFDDDGGGKEEVVLDSWPATGAIVRALTVDFGPSDLVLVEGGSATVVVELSGAPGREVTIPVGVSANRGATDADFAVAGFGTVPASVNLTFGPSETRKEITFTATDDSEVDLFESVSPTSATQRQNGRKSLIYCCPEP